MKSPASRKGADEARFTDTAVQRYARQLRSFLLRRLRQRQQVDDVAQEVYLRLLRMDAAKRIERPLPFLYGVAAHVVADFRIALTTEKQRMHFDDEMIREWSEHPAELTPNELEDRVALEQQLKWALNQLPPMQAAVLLAHKRDGLTYEEVARELKLSVDTVHKYLTLAKAKMRTLIWD